MKDFKKYRWFYTSSGKLVIGGKSSMQNDELLRKLKQEKEERVVMHTASPGSPFSIIYGQPQQVTEKDEQETAIFTGCFSQQWKSGKKSAVIDVFFLSQLYKTKSMKAGTWGVNEKSKRMKVTLELVLVIQDGLLRAVPVSAVPTKNVLLKIRPGKIDKREMLPKFQIMLDKHFSEEELLSAIPAGGVSIVNK